MTEKQVAISSLALSVALAIFNVIGAFKPNWVTRSDKRYPTVAGVEEVKADVTAVKDEVTAIKGALKGLHPYNEDDGKLLPAGEIKITEENRETFKPLLPEKK